LVVVGDAGTVLTSLDGVTWTNGISGTSNRLDAVMATTNVMVAVGFGGTILTTTNGLDWVQAESGTGRWLHDVTAGEGLQVAVGELGTILTSTNGTDWELVESGVSRHLFGVGFDEEGFVAAGQSGIVLRSVNGTEWVESETGTGLWIFGVATGEETVLVGDAGLILTPLLETGEPLVLTDAGWMDGIGFGFVIEGVLQGQQVTVETSIDLEEWSVLGSFTAETAPMIFVDEGAIEPGRLFYRVRSP
jgi:hypothetical protein